MADSTTNLDQIATSQAGKEITANSVLNAASPAITFGRHDSACIGLTWGYYGGVTPIDGVPTAFANGTIALTASATNYIRATTTGSPKAWSIVKSTSPPSGWPGPLAGDDLALFEIVAGASTVTSWKDWRVSGGGSAAAGAQGAQGAAGAAGAQGPQGATGVGTTGPQGPQGASGAQGAQGSQGSQGNQGTQGTTGTGTPGGSTTQVQYNSSGSFAGDSRLTFDATNKILTGQFAIDSNAINAQTGTTYTLAASDNGKVVTLSNASAITVTVPSGLGAGFSCICIQLGAGQVSFSASGTTINPSTTLKIAAQHGAASLIAYASNTFNLSGNISA